ncbi:ribosylnicotinamide kinase [Apophysomyces ossiformis]|uniref:Ribosylnicotinamide kinase n=1 Tax=Apophysomyces ossiformis TaxID=679940 RepID=A0A8H7ESV2_9FUNG|nr:ribosylnicotinamide kinase [Apophysomyces ossiformis]
MQEKQPNLEMAQNVRKERKLIWSCICQPDDQIPVDPVTQLANWDCPDALDFDRLRETLEYVRRHGGQLPPGYDSTEVRNTHDGSSLVPEDTIQSTRALMANHKDDLFVLVDGFLLYYDPALTAEFDVKLFYTASYDTLKYRRENRKGYTTTDGYWVDPPGYFDKIVWPEYVRWNKPFVDQDNQKREETLIIDTDKHTIVQAIEATTHKILDSLLE